MIEWAITSFVLATVALILYFWTKIVEFFSCTVIPWIRKNMGDTVADIIAEVIIFIDKGVVAVKKTAESVLSKFKEYWKKLHKYILKKVREYIVNDNGTYTLKETVYIPCENDSKSAKVITQQSEVEWEHLPSEIRYERIQKNAQKMKLDDKKIMEHKLLENAEKNGVSKKELLELKC